MDEKIRETIDYARYTLEHAPDVETLEWETGVVRDLLYKIEELVEGIERHRDKRYGKNWQAEHGMKLYLDPADPELYGLIDKGGSKNG